MSALQSRETADRTLYWTLSLHIDEDLLRRETPALHAAFGGVEQGQASFDAALYKDRPTKAIETRIERLLAIRAANQARQPNSEALANAMEPMFYDISDRERLGSSPSYLLGVSYGGEQTHETVTLVFDPERLAWQTEGHMASVALDGPVSHTVEVRRFWNVHSDLGLSYHIGITLAGYSHTPADLYLISTLQKLTAPKEFTLPHPGGIEQGKTPEVAAFKAVSIADASGRADFWQFMIARFNADFEALHKTLCPDAKREGSAWAQLVEQENYVELPGLKMPQARAMFYFADRDFRDILLSAQIARDSFNKGFFNRILAEKRAAWSARAQASAGGPAICYDARFWSWLEEASGTAFASPPGEDATIPAPVSAADRCRALCWLFLAGFNQNIIDFVNQDASEILDSMDPLTPPETDGQTFFARYANPRAFITYVDTMRSLEIGAAYLGTCPYAFLIHALTLHNELLARRFEKRANARIALVQHLAARNKWNEAKNIFFEFQRREQQDFIEYFCTNVFRYDTENSVFAALESIRGIDARYRHVLRKLRNAETATTEAQARIIVDDDRKLNLLVAFIGVFSVLQVAFMATDAWRRIHLREQEGLAPDNFDFAETLEIGFALFAIGGVMLLIAVLFIQWILRRLR